MANKTDRSLLSKSIADKWKGPASHIATGREQVRFWVKGAGDRVALDSWIESFSFDDLPDQAPVISGSASLRQALEKSPIPTIRTADQVICEVRPSPTGKWSELVRMRVYEPQWLASGQFTFQLQNDAALLTISKDSYKFPKDKAHPNGWRPWQIIDEVGKRNLIRVVMPKIGKPIKKFTPMINSTPFDVINTALKKLRDAELKTLIARYEAGTVYFNQRHYSPELMTLGPQLIDASLVETRKEGWATALTIRTSVETGTSKDAKGKKKATHKGIVVELPVAVAKGAKYPDPAKVKRDPFVKRYGYVHLIVYAHGAQSTAEVRQMGLAHLARVLQPNRSLTLTTPYISGLRRGAYIRLAIPTLGLRQIVYVQGISYTMSAGLLQMDVTCGFDDPQITPPVDNVNDNSRNLTKKKKTPPSPKTDKATQKPPKPVPVGFGVATP